ncbi:MAG: hypothetical protein HQM09_13935 [Candidatus Riflebacteria bacterium]|nr:hypothetical protein [Candidatus Riflebacteria bacterium]
MSERYSPHAVQKKARDWSSEASNEYRSKTYDTILQARCLWLKDGPWINPMSTMIPDNTAPDLLEEYGFDAVLLASLTAPSGTFPDESLLESALRWLSQWYDRLIRNKLSAPFPAWDPTPWLCAAAAAQDHLFLRNRHYPALAAIKKAWKDAPVHSGSPRDAIALALLLMMPFAPILGRSLWEILFPKPDNYAWPPPLLTTVTDTFRPLRAVLIAMEKSGRRYETVDETRLKSDPRAVISELPWVRRLLAGSAWTVRHDGTVWRVHIEASKC